MNGPARVPLQQRSRETLERLLAAGVALLEERGFEALSIAEVSLRAGVSVGSIYQRFDGKEALFAAVQVRVLERIDAEQAELFATIDPTLPDPALVIEAVRRLADFFRRNEAVLRVMILRGAVDEATRLRGSRSSVGLARTFERFLLSSLGAIRHPEPTVAADVAFRIVYATLTRRIMSGPTFESEADIGWDLLAAETGRACAAYLLADAGTV